MGFLINDVITLENGDCYVVVDKVERFDDKYYYIVALDEDKKKLKSTCRIVKTAKYNEKQYISLVDDKQELRHIIPLFLSHYA